MHTLIRPLSNCGVSAAIIGRATTTLRTARIASAFSCSLMSKRKLGARDDPLLIYHHRPSQIRRMATQPATTTIPLTPKEEQLKGLLLDVARYIDEDQPAAAAGTAAEPVILRWAGGWVRDKLLGIESHDIDVAINVMTGEAFAVKIGELCERRPEAVRRHGVEQTDIGNLHKIARNPDKSKHLETTTVRLLGYDVDFVNLRRETYAEDSRNPQVEFGTAEEDALRRDATVNALFYNLNTGMVEDFTTGLTDMEAKRIRTPLEPLQTFMDDPLRVLRLIRFASRLEFSIDPAAEDVMGDRRVLEALRLKISRERVGGELEKMLKGNHPRRSLQYIDDLGLYQTIFTDPSNGDFPTPETSHWKVAYDTLDTLRRNKTPGSIYDTLVRSDEATYFSWVLAAVAPFGRLGQPPHTGKGKSPPPYGTLATREGIKAPHKLCDVCTAAINHREEIMALKRAVLEGSPDVVRERDRFGMAIRHWEAKGGHWRLQVLSALLVEAMEVLPLTANSNGTPDNADRTEESFLREWQAFLDHLGALDVLEAPSLKRIIDGTQLAKALGVKPGKWMAPALEVCIAWQLRHPDVTDPAGAIEEVKARKEELGIPG